jgi:hypothetical protein
MSVTNINGEAWADMTKWNGEAVGDITAINGATAEAGFSYNNVITYSCMFEAASSTYLSLGTSDGADNATKGSLSVWFKRSKVGASQTIISGDLESGDSADYCMIKLGASDDLQFYMNVSSVAVCRQYSNAKFRDCSGWYHLVFIWDSTSGVGAAARQPVMYINGKNVETELGGWGTETVNIAQNTHIRWCHNDANSITAIGRDVVGSDDYYCGYMSYFEWVDGLALTATSFGQFANANDNVWIPKDGTTGFKLTFADNTSFGDDTSGGTNDFTDNNFGTDHQVIDNPENNFCILDWNTQTSGLDLMREGGTWIYETALANYGALGTFLLKSGKWYWEVEVSGNTNPYWCTIGVVAAGEVSGDFKVADATLNRAGCAIFGMTYGTTSYYVGANGGALNDDTNLAAPAKGDIMMVAFDADSGKFWAGVNGTWGNFGGGVGDPANDSNPARTITNVGLYACVPFVTLTDQSDWTSAQAAFGADQNLTQTTFDYTPPTGFNSLCTDNLTAPTIIQSEGHFNTVTWNGNVSATQAITGVGFQPDIVWIKNRDQDDPNLVFDSTRGATKYWDSDSNLGETTDADTLESFDADGFTVGDDVKVNTNGEKYVAWCWKVSATAGIDIVTYTGTGAAHAENHNLGVVPEFMILYNLDSGHNPLIYHAYFDSKNEPETHYNLLSLVNAEIDATNIWNDTAPTTTQFTVGTHDAVTELDQNFIVYLFASVPGFSKVFMYDGNGSADGPYIYCGFRPAMILSKNCESGSGNWRIADNRRGDVVGFNFIDYDSYPSLTSAESTAGGDVDFLANGFKIRDTASNANDNQHFGIAFAEQPFKYSNAR